MMRGGGGSPSVGGRGLGMCGFTWDTWKTGWIPQQGGDWVHLLRDTERLDVPRRHLLGRPWKKNVLRR